MQDLDPDWKRVLWAGLAAALAGVAVHANALHKELLRDDVSIIVHDERIRGGEWMALALGDYWPASSGGRDRLYRPLTSLSFAAQRWSGPFGLRIVNILLHGATSALVCVWVAGAWRSAAAGAAAGLLFAVHPMHTEPLNVIVGRADIAATFFALAAFMLTPRRPIAGSILFGAALLSKEQVVLLPLVMLLVDRRSAIAWIGVVVMYLGLRYAALGTLMRDPTTILVTDNVLAHPETNLPSGGSVLMARWGTPIALFGKAMGLLFWPDPLCNDYSYAAIPLVYHVFDVRFLVGLLTIAAALTALVIGRRGPVGVGVGWALASYAVVANGPILIGTIFADRLLYLPSAGICMAAGGLVVGRRKVLFGVLMALAVAAGAWRTFLRNADWRSLDALVRADYPKQPRSARLLGLMGVIELKAGRAAAALDYCQQAAAIDPSLPVEDVLGLAHYRMGHDREALEAFERDFRRGGGKNEEAVIAAADLLRKFGDTPQAIALLEKHLARFPTWRDAAASLEALKTGRSSPREAR